MRRPADVPADEPDLYSMRAILDPHPPYARLRWLGPVVWLTKQRVYALPRYAQCKAVLRDDTTFSSGDGVGLNRIFNMLSRGTTLNSDGDEHDRRRKLVAHRLLPRASRTMSDVVARQAEQLVAAAVRRQRVDGVDDLATALPLSVVPDLVGWPEYRREHLLRCGGATFDVLGPLNRYALKSVQTTLQMLRFSKNMVRRRSVIHGGMGHDILAAADAGKLPRRKCSALIIDYLVPSLDTTIRGIANALAFAMHPGPVGAAARRAVPAAQCDQRGAAVRIAVAGFHPKLLQPNEIADIPIPAGSRVLVLYASANRDEQEWRDPDVFDIRRSTTRHLGFGHGTHACAGQGLVRLEMQAMLTALMQQVSRIELAGEPIWALNNIIRWYERLPLRLISV